MGILSIDPSASVHPSCILTPSEYASCDIIIGKNVIIEPFVRILPSGGVGKIVIEESAVLNVGVVIYGGGGVIIGSHSLLGAHSVVSATTHNYLKRDCPIRTQGHKNNLLPISIGSDCWIGSHSFVGPEVELADGCVFPDHSSIVKSFTAPYTVFDRKLSPVFVRR